MVEKKVVEPPRLCIVTEFEITQGEVIETLAPSLRRVSEYIREQSNAFLLLVAGGGLD